MKDTRNIYYNARQTAGYTQERWAELLGISPEAVRQYEAGIITPVDEIALRMAEAAGQHIICYWHLLNKSRVAGTILPNLSELRLPEAVLQLLVQMEAFRTEWLPVLTRISMDGQITPDEEAEYRAALDSLQTLIQAALHVTFATTKN